MLVLTVANITYLELGGDIIKIAPFSTLKKGHPFSPCTVIEWTVGVARVAKYYEVAVACHHDARTPVARAGDTPLEILRGWWVYSHMVFLLLLLDGTELR